MNGERGQFISHIVSDLPGWDDQAEAAILFVRLARQQAPLHQTVHDPGDRAVREPHAPAEILETHCVCVHYRLHHTALRARQAAAGELCLERLAEDTADAPEVLVKLLGHAREFLCAGQGSGHSTNGISAFTCRSYSVYSAPNCSIINRSSTFDFSRH